MIAAAMGVPPMLSIAGARATRGDLVQFVYAGASLARMALVDDVVSLRAAGVNVWVNADDIGGRLEFAGLIDASADATLYACGPSGLLDGLGRLTAEGGQPLFVERFGQATSVNVGDSNDAEGASPSDRFEVELATSRVLGRAR